MTFFVVPAQTQPLWGWMYGSRVGVNESLSKNYLFTAAMVELKSRRRERESERGRERDRARERECEKERERPTSIPPSPLRVVQVWPRVLQVYLARKKRPPPARATKGP